MPGPRGVGGSAALRRVAPARSTERSEVRMGGGRWWQEGTELREVVECQHMHPHTSDRMSRTRLYGGTMPPFR